MTHAHGHISFRELHEAPHEHAAAGPACACGASARASRGFRGFRGFTLIEMLVVIAIVMIMLAISVPTMNALQKDGRKEGGINTVSVSVDVARAWVNKPKADLMTVTGADYSGVAALFTPGGEIRLVQNDQKAVDTGNNWLETQQLNGYADIEGLDYITLPRRTGIAGVYRNVLGVDYLAPPFAVAFNKHGNMLNRANNTATGVREDLIYYDADWDEQYDTTAYRPAGYDPYAWDPRRTTMAVLPGPLRYELPFEAIETVVGVVIYDQDDFDGAGLDWSAGNAAARATWFENPDNTRVMFFSPHTGVGIRIE